MDRSFNHFRKTVSESQRGILSGEGWVSPFVWHNQDVPAEFRFDLFNLQTAYMNDPLVSEPYRIPPEDFVARTSTVLMPNVKAGHRRSGPLSRINRVKSANNADGDKIQLFVLLHGEFIMESRGVQERFRAGAMCFAFDDEPYTVRYAKPHQVVRLELPLDRLSVTERELRKMAVVEHRGNQVFPSLLANTIGSLLHTPCIDVVGAESILLGTAELILRTALNLNPDHGDTRASRRNQIKRFVVDNLSEQNLCINTIADALHVSPRVVCKAFEGHHETVTEFIQRKRVEYVVNFIQNEESAVFCSIEQIALNAGFGSTRSLVRSFQKFYGVTPLEYMRSHSLRAGARKQKILKIAQ